MKLPPVIHVLVLSLGLVLAGAATANDFDDREALTDLLTQDEIAPLADAEEDLALAEDTLAAAVVERDAAQAELDSAAETLATATDDLAEAQTIFDSAAADLAAAEAAAGSAADDVTEAQMILDAADQALADGITAGTTGQDLIDLETAVSDATTALNTTTGELQTAEAAEDDAQMVFDDAQTDLMASQDAVNSAQAAADGAQMALDDSQGVVDDRSMDRDDAIAVVQMIVDEIDGTAEFVDNLDDRTVFALNRSLNNAVRTGLLPLDIDLDLLNRIIDEDFGDGEIQQLTNAFEIQARFERLAARFEDKAAATGNDKFESHAERARARGAERKTAFLDRLGDADETGEAAAEAADAASDAVDTAGEQAAAAIGLVAREAAADAAEATIGEIASDLAQEIDRGRRI